MKHVLPVESETRAPVRFVIGLPELLEKARKLHRRRKVAGFDVSVETQRGAYRHWKDRLGNSGKTLMRFDYGYIRRTEGMDGEHMDVYVGPDPNPTHVYVITQNSKASNFEHVDEQKVMLGFSSAQEAKNAYLSQYDDPRFFRDLVAMPIEEFRMKVHAKDNHGELLRSQRYVIQNVIRKAANTPPAGYEVVVASKHGGYRKKIGGRYVYWYPDYAGTTFRPSWTEAQFSAGRFDKDPQHWRFKRTNGQAIAWTHGGVDPHSQHPVKEAGVDHRLYQIAKLDTPKAGWALLHNLKTGEHKAVAYDRIMPVQWLRERAAPKGQEPPAPAWNPEHDDEEHEGPAVHAGAKLPRFIDSRAEPGTALHAVEGGVFGYKQVRNIEQDADGAKRKLVRSEPDIPDATKVKLIAEFEGLLSKSAERSRRRFSLPARWLDEGNRRRSLTLEDLHAAATEGLLHAMRTYPGGMPFAAWAKTWVTDYANVEAGQMFSGVSLPQRHVRLLARYVAARAQAAHALETDTPTPAQVAGFWTVRKRDIHSGLDKEQGAQMVPLTAYSIKEPAKGARSERKHPGKAEWAARMHEFLTGQQGLISSAGEDEGPAFPAANVGYGMGTSERVAVRASARKVLAKLEQHELKIEGGKYRTNTAEILAQALGLRGEEPREVATVLATVPIEKQAQDGSWKRLGRTAALNVAPKFMDAGLRLLKREMGDRAGLIEQATRKLIPIVRVPAGPTFRELLKRRARDVTPAEVKAWRNDERARLARIRARVQSALRSQTAGTAEHAYHMGMLSSVHDALQRINGLSNKQAALRVVQAQSSESVEMRKLQVRTVTAEADDRDIAIGRGLIQMRDPGTGKDRNVQVATFRSLVDATSRPTSGAQKSERSDDKTQQSARIESARFPLLSRLLYAPDDALSFAPTRERLKLEELVGLVHA